MSSDAKPCLNTCTEATLDIEAVVEEAFSGEIGFTGLLACVSDTAILRFLQMVGGQFSALIDPLLRQSLRTQLEVGQRFARLWTQDNLDLGKLVAVWQEQTEAIARWQLLQSLLEDKNSCLTLKSDLRSDSK